MSRLKLWFSIALVLLVFSGVFTVMPVRAAEGDEAAPVVDAGAADNTPPADGTATTTEKKKKGGANVPNGPVEMVLNSGYIGYLICILSVVTVGLVIENLMSIKREKMMPEDLLADIENALDNGSYEEALEICQSEDCMMTRIIGAGLGKMSMGFERMEEAIAEESDAQATMLHQKLGYINLIAGTAPMMGLLGTVSGMIGAFGEIATNPQASPADLAAGIYVALMTTLLGLIVAIPASVAFTFFRGRVTKILMVMSIINGEVLDRFRGGEEEYYEE